MHLVDHLFLLLLFAVQPIHGALAYRRYIARIEAGEPPNRVRLYVQTLVLQWMALAVLGLTWFLLGRPGADLGFVVPAGSNFSIGAAALVIVTAFLIYSWRGAASMNDVARAKHKASFGKLVHFLPHSNRDYRYFVGVSMTAGVVEEILYRGFAFWYLLQFIPIWAAVIASAVIFGLGHSYQGVGGVVRVTLIGLAFGIFYVFTGSIWLPILAHAILDVLQGATILEILRKSDNLAEPLSA
jgi:membrane protease YdiL (CAAX protease family)